MAAAVSAALGLALLVPALTVGASAGSLPFYNLQATVKGVEATFALKPHIIDPLAQVAGPFGRTAFDSAPSSASLASALYPGDLPQFVLDEEGPAANAGLPFSYPFTLKSRYPDRQDREKSVSSAALKERGISVDAVRMRTVATLLETKAIAAAEQVRLQPDPDAVPVIVADSIVASAEGMNADGAVTQVSTVRASGVEVLGIIRIDEIVSEARAVSDGVTVTDISSSIRFTGVAVTDATGASHGAVIDEDGIRIEDPTLGTEINQALNYKLQQTLAKSGVIIAASDTTTISEGPTGEAIAGGLLVTIRSGTCDACYSVLGQLPAIPRAVRDAVPDIVICDPLGAAPVCVTPNLVPIPPDVEVTASVASARALASATTGFDFGGTTGGTTGGDFAPIGGTTGTSVLGEQFFNPTTGGTTAPPGTTGGTIVTPAAPPAPGAAPVGLVSKIPPAALAVPGVLLLLLAVGMALVPALGREPAP